MTSSTPRHSVTTRREAVAHERMVERIILDCDPGNGVPATDIDDGLALGLLLASSRTRVEAVTVVTGNTHRDVGYDVARTMLEDIGANVPVYAGAAEALVEPSAPWKARREGDRTSAQATEMWAGVPGPRGHDPQFDYSAAAEIVRRISAAPGEITIVAIGPLTNIAHALQLRPQIAQEVKRIVVMGGAFDLPGFLQELNFAVDPEAARIVLACGADVTLVPLDVTYFTTLTLTDVERLRSVETPLAQYLSATTEPWIRWCESRSHLQRRGCRLHDPLAAAILLDPSLVTTERCAVDVQLTGLVRSRPVRWDPERPQFAFGLDVPTHPLISVVVGVDNDRLVQTLMETLSTTRADYQGPATR